MNSLIAIHLGFIKKICLIIVFVQASCFIFKIVFSFNSDEANRREYTFANKREYTFGYFIKYFLFKSILK
jgi:Ni,Fe-hydrogenase I cytochrome b subunit